MARSLREKLDELAVLEKKYNVVGVSIMTDPDNPNVTTEEAIDFVLAFVKQAAETMRKAHERIPYHPDFVEAMNNLDEHRQETRDAEEAAGDEAKAIQLNSESAQEDSSEQLPDDK